METLKPEQIEQAQVFINNTYPGFYVIEDILGDSWSDIAQTDFYYAQKFRTTVRLRLFENIACHYQVNLKRHVYMVHP